MTDAVTAEGLVKSYGTTRALDGVDLTVPQGTVLGLLGPNGAGKTTAVRILTTLLAPDAGTARVMGLDVVRDADRLRSVIGLTGQYAAVDGLLTGRENLRLVGDLYHLPRKRSAQRADELLERFDLADAADRTAKTYSGGMRRRLDLAASLVNEAPVLFLDEPTTGLDPRSRIDLWEVIADLVKGGTTLLLTTQYLEEADRLSNRIAVIDQGRVIAEGTSDELKSKVGGEVVEVRLGDAADAGAARQILARLADGDLQDAGDPLLLTLPATGGVRTVAEAARLLDDAGVAVVELAMRRPTLDDVFLTLTGRGAERGDGDDGPAPSPRRSARRARSAA